MEYYILLDGHGRTEVVPKVFTNVNYAYEYVTKFKLNQKGKKVKVVSVVKVF